ncbi:MAG: riboflavin synthase [Spirochaetia bacterium]
MFTGLIEEVGTVEGVSGTGGFRKIRIQARIMVEDMKIGDSIAINGACQTVTDFTAQGFTVQALAETLGKTTLSTLAPGVKVNLERALLPTTRLGGHFVQGHVNALGTIVSLQKKGENTYLSVKLDREVMKYCVAEGSITIDGISLTISSVTGTTVTVNIIPHTYEHTILKYKQPGDRVNIETDILGRYAVLFLEQADKGLDFKKLKAYGY